MDGCRRRRRTASPPPPPSRRGGFDYIPLDGEGRRRMRVDPRSPPPLRGIDYGRFFSGIDGDWRRRPMYVEYIDTPEGLSRLGYHGTLLREYLHGPAYDDHPDRRMGRYTVVTVVLGGDDDERDPRVADDDATLRRQLPEVVAPASGANCAICLQDLDPEEEDHEEATPRAMPCSHAFHERCIFQWVRRNRDCPLCRRTLPTPEQQEYSYDDDDRLQMTMPVPREMLEIEVL